MYYYIIMKLGSGVSFCRLHSYKRKTHTGRNLYVIMTQNRAITAEIVITKPKLT